MICVPCENGDHGRCRRYGPLNSDCQCPLCMPQPAFKPTLEEKSVNDLDDQIDTALNALNREIEEVEDWLCEQGLGRAPAAVLLNEGRQLAWKKLNGRQHLVVVSADGSEKALVQISARVRLEAAGRVADLVTEVRERHAVMLKDVQAAKEKLRALRREEK